MDDFENEERDYSEPEPIECSYVVNYSCQNSAAIQTFVMIA